MNMVMWKCELFQWELFIDSIRAECPFKKNIIVQYLIQGIQICIHHYKNNSIIIIIIIKSINFHDGTNDLIFYIQYIKGRKPSQTWNSIINLLQK